jgi:hypothetical protein
MTLKIPLGQPMSLSPLLTASIDPSRPLQHVLVCGDNDAGHAMVLSAICAAALLGADTPRAATVTNYHPSPLIRETTTAIASASHGRIESRESEAFLLGSMNPSEISIVTGVDSSGKELARTDPHAYGMDDDADSEPAPGDAILERLENGHRTGGLVVVFATRPTVLTDLFGHGILDYFGFRIAFAMPEKESNLVLDSRDALGLKERAILRQPTGATEEFIPFRPSSSDALSELSLISSLGVG